MAVLCFFYSCIACSEQQKENLEKEVKQTIDQLHLHDAVDTQSEAFAKLQRLGRPAIPFIIKHMDSRKKLKHRSISLVSGSSKNFESVRNYSPELVVDGVAAVLNQITGQHFGNIYNGGSETERDQTVMQWRTGLRQPP